MRPLLQLILLMLSLPMLCSLMLRLLMLTLPMLCLLTLCLLMPAPLKLTDCLCESLLKFATVS